MSLPCVLSVLSLHVSADSNAAARTLCCRCCIKQAKIHSTARAGDLLTVLDHEARDCCGNRSVSGFCRGGACLGSHLLEGALVRGVLLGLCCSSGLCFGRSGVSVGVLVDSVVLGEVGTLEAFGGSPECA